MSKQSKPNELPNDGCTCCDCPYFIPNPRPDPSSKDFGECEKTGFSITEENHLTKGENACPFFDM